MTVDPAQTSASIRAIVIARVPRLSEDEVLDDQPFGSEGLGLDSIAIAEVLLDCERRLGVRMTDLLDGPPITVARIASRALSG